MSDTNGASGSGRRKVRVRRRRRPPRRRLINRSLLGLLLFVLAVGAVTGAQALSARNALDTVQGALDDARAALAAGDLDRAGDRVRSARIAADRAHRTTNGPHWRLLSAVPVLGDTPRAVRGVVDLVDPAVEVAEDGLELAGDFLADERGLLLRTEDGRFDLAPLEGVAHALRQLPIARIESARAALADVPDRWLPRVVRDGRADAIAAADELVRTIDRGIIGADLTPALLGANQPRRFLLLVQNSGELRGTGGIIGFMAELEVDRGALTLGDPEGLDPRVPVEGTDILARGRFDSLIGQDVDAPEGFATRYDHIAARSFLASTNADPDLPTVAPVAMQIYEETTGRSLDGVVVIDPVALQRVYTAIGPLQVPEAAAALAPQLPNPIRPDRLAQILLIDTYETLGGPTEERRGYQTAVATAALDEFLTSPWDGITVGRAIGQSVAGRNLQVYSANPDEQAALEELGVAGQLRPVRDGDDLIAVSANNAAGTKGDVHVAHRLEAVLALDRPRQEAGRAVVDQRLTTRIEVESAVDPDSDEYISRSLRTQRLGEVRETDPRPGLSRTWFSQWIDAEAVVMSVRTLEGGIAPFSVGEMHDRRVIDHYLETPTGQTTGFQTVVDTTREVEWDGRKMTYAVTFWRQGKAIVDHLDITVQPPGDWTIVEADVQGGGTPTGLGPAPGGDPVAARLDEGELRLTGAMTADVRLVIRLQPS